MQIGRRIRDYAERWTEKQKIADFRSQRFFQVVQEGLEPSQAEPESEVLPLHHWTMSSFLTLQRYIHFFNPATVLQEIFSKYQSKAI